MGVVVVKWKSYLRAVLHYCILKEQSTHHDPVSEHLLRDTSEGGSGLQHSHAPSAIRVNNIQAPSVAFVFDPAIMKSTPRVFLVGRLVV